MRELENLVNYFVAGVDETATERKAVEGWCYFCLPQSSYDKFQKEVKSLLGTSNIISFHGSKFLKEQAYEYEKFLGLIKKYVESTFPSLLSCSLLSLSQKNDFKDYSDQVTGEFFRIWNVKSKTTINNKAIIYYKRITPSLLRLIELIQHFGPNYKFKIEIDTDNDKKNLQKYTTELSGETDFAERLLASFYNSYKDNSNFKDTPWLEMDGVSFLKDQKSFLIQGADVIGNFSTCYLYHKLGDSSETRKIKSEVFENIFGNTMIKNEVLEQLQLSGNEIKFPYHGSLDFVISLSKWN